MRKGSLQGVLAVVVVLGIGAGCRPSPEDSGGPMPTGSTGSGTVGTGTTSGTPTGTGGGTTTGLTTGTLCEVTPPAAPTTWNRLTHVPNSEEFAFDTLGNLLNISDQDNVLYSSTYAGTTTVLAPYASAEVGGIQFRATGESLVVADEGSGILVDLTTSGSTEVLLGAIVEPNSVAIHRDGWIYTTAQDRIYKVDPDAILPAEEQIYIPGTDLDGLVFSNDYQKLYFNHDEDGLILEAEVLAGGDLAPPVQIANLAVGQAELDGMAIDECDNIYALFTDGRIRRVRPNGNHREFVSLTSPIGLFTTGLHFGSGLGDWKTDHLYVMNRNGEVIELYVGLNGKPDPHQ